jgi:sugar/nucleoside kinase (ribokinase family)
MPSIERVPDYLVVGHVTKDVVDGGYRPGGTATYAALTAQRLGLQVGVLTSTGPDVSPFPDGPMMVHNVPSDASTVFENIYRGRSRKQYVRSAASVLHPADVPLAWRSARIVHLGPVAQEVSPALASAFPGALVGVTPQGWLRRWDRDGLVVPVAWADSALVLEAVDVVVLSLEDLGGDRALLDRYIERARLLILTVGDGGCIVHREGRQQRIPAFAVKELDPTGAGDVFAAGFLIRYADTRDAGDAARFANCVASFVVEGPGHSTIPTRDQVEDRLAHGLLRE